MDNIRKADKTDLIRIAEILIFNYRMYFYSIFQDDDFYFVTLQVPTVMQWYEGHLDSIWVYDDGVVKGFIQVEDKEIKKLFVEPVLHNASIGSKLLTNAIEEQHADFLWALEKNSKAIHFTNDMDSIKLKIKNLKKILRSFLFAWSVNFILEGMFIFQLNVPW